MNEISKRVAEACGWSTENMAGYVGLFYRGVYQPRDGKIDGTGYYFSHEDAWAAATDYEHDVTACIAALDETGMAWILKRLPTEKSLWATSDMEFDDNKRYLCGIGRPLEDIALGPVSEYGATPALAICAALLAWYEH